jgi:hypothetical protein
MAYSSGNILDLLSRNSTSSLLYPSGTRSTAGRGYEAV